ncbi:hypothetical protein K469DRAFT_748235 [Zopfia rhizophila CBS 207.26]|uniref:Utp8 beta-propeller domain-containing protein n=1 Tax=Zopfia rhizophila CBS 207.26 TaxID=1314779 RepID=A0A6A6EB22_9PEZI|nr:hypothetical protein K469DRAFT_748235 [Zopfia rhizophila CBS 207.26]
MSSEKDIEAPFALASLPHPIDSNNGRTQAAGVCSISGSKKRKRTEAAVAIDGEGIFIYSLQNPQLVTSYALPPQTYFTTAPYSLYRKGASGKPSCRFTYAFVKQSSPGEKPQLVCFREEIHKDATSNAAKSSYTISNTADKVVSIDSIPTSSGVYAKNNSHDVLVIFDNGHVICLSADLNSSRWTSNIGSLSSSGEKIQAKDEFDVEHVNLTTAKSVLRGLLRSREDIAAILDPSLDGKSELLEITQVLCVVARRWESRAPENSQRILGLFQLAPRSTDLITSYLPPIKHLLTWQLPLTTSPPLTFTSKPFYSLHSTTGILHQLFNGAITSYDFSGTVPTVYSKLEVPGRGIKSFVRLSSDLIFATSPNSCGIYDLKYNSVQSILSLRLNQNIPNESKKRKHEASGSIGGSIETAPFLVTYFTELGLAVGILNHELVGIQLAGSLGRKKVRTDSSLLIDSIGKGIRFEASRSQRDDNRSPPKPLISYIVGMPSKDNPQWQSWQKKARKLDKMASKGRIAEFEELLSAELGVKLGPLETEHNGSEVNSQAELQHGTPKSVLTNGVSEDDPASLHESAVATKKESLHGEIRKWQLPKVIPDSQRQNHRQQAIFALGKIFGWSSNDPATRKNSSQSSIRVEFFPPNVFQWLLLSGFLTKESIQRALLDVSSEKPEKPEKTASISDGDIVKAIVEFDPELHILSAILNHSHFLPIGEVVQAIRLLMQSLDGRPKANSTPRLITHGAAASEDEMDIDFISELEAATHDLDHALSILDNGLSIRSHTLRPALIRLHTFPTTVVISTLRNTLPRPDLESLMQLLHLELKSGGWTSPYDFADSENPVADAEAASEDPDDHAIAIIASLLSCALDAIGSGAWLATVGQRDESAEELVHELHEETTLALSGFWEARFIRGLLSEFLRYAVKSSKSQKPTNKSLQNQGKPLLIDAAMEQTLPMLPLGGKVDQGVEKTKIGKGGSREERSAREMGMLISKRVPKYSFERIVI